ncbi:hypothetical protein AVEN_174996-1 [Araneus ventricosus]|uniref:Uncharacterized protein n=1 Tax=Araneus ventricosus TaxID=182803 RepID=A0A4Y2KKM7_ARAVE|nr:hypothetical protein AVEN_174996-1 [Araneus ventricosus]
MFTDIYSTGESYAAMPKNLGQTLYSNYKSNSCKLESFRKKNFILKRTFTGIKIAFSTNVYGYVQHREELCWNAQESWIDASEQLQIKILQARKLLCQC